MDGLFVHEVLRDPPEQMEECMQIGAYLSQKIDAWSEPKDKLKCSGTFLHAHGTSPKQRVQMKNMISRRMSLVQEEITDVNIKSE